MEILWPGFRSCIELLLGFDFHEGLTNVMLLNIASIFYQRNTHFWLERNSPMVCVFPKITVKPMRVCIKQ